MAIEGAQLQVLADEINNDPLAFGYGTLKDSEIADKLNALNTGRTVPNDTEIPTWQIFSKFVASDYINALLDNRKAQILSHVLSMGVVQAGDNNLRDALIEVFGVGSQTITNLIPLRTRTASRAEELGLPRMTPSDVANAKKV